MASDSKINTGDNKRFTVRSFSPLFEKLDAVIFYYTCTNNTQC